MRVKGIMDENFQDFKQISFYVAFPSCTFKCEREAGPDAHFCSNCDLVKYPDIEVSAKELAERYAKSALSSAVVCGGLEPLDDFRDLVDFVSEIRKISNDPIVIYTGYYPNEIEDKLAKLKEFTNIIMKFGRFIPNSKSRYDEILGITLASENQYAEKIS